MLLKFMVRLMDNHVITLSDELPTKEMVRELIVLLERHQLKISKFEFDLAYFIFEILERPVIFMRKKMRD